MRACGFSGHFLRSYSWKARRRDVEQKRAETASIRWNIDSPRLTFVDKAFCMQVHAIVK